MILDHAAIAHRGGAGLAPENTLAAFSLSYALGVRHLETDVQTTRDGVAVAFHDADLARCTGVEARVRDLTWSELRSVRVDGEPIVRLDDLLASFTDAMFLIDIKSHRNILACIEAVNRVGAGDRVCVADGREGWLQEIARATGAWRALGWGELLRLLTAAKLGARAPWPVGLTQTGTARVGGMMGAASHDALTAHVPTRLGGFDWMADRRTASRLVEMTHDADLQLVTWTVDDPTLMHRYIDAGADAIITDRPDLLREVLIARGMWGATAAMPRQAAKLTPCEASTTTLTRSPAARALTSSSPG